jgi:hypothetical protein
MRRRTMLATIGGAALAPMAPRGAASTSVRHVAIDDVTFDWRHSGDRLHGTLTAPTRGWIAVGFNMSRRLSGTRFVISITRPKPTAEMHVALVPEHPTIEFLGGRSGLADVSGRSDDTQSTVKFSLPHLNAAPFDLDLSPGTPVYLMLAWSHEADFAHHSAWRRHLDVVL